MFAGTSRAGLQTRFPEWPWRRRRNSRIPCCGRSTGAPHIRKGMSSYGRWHAMRSCIGVADGTRFPGSTLDTRTGWRPGSLGFLESTPVTREPRQTRSGLIAVGEDSLSAAKEETMDEDSLHQVLVGELDGCRHRYLQASVCARAFECHSGGPPGVPKKHLVAALAEWAIRVGFTARAVWVDGIRLIWQRRRWNTMG